MENNEQAEKFELIIVIVNKGSTDLVMDAARKSGSHGGTITVARGTGNPDLAKFYGLAIQPEKEMVFIVVNRDIKDQVLKNIYDEAGINTQGQGIAFSLPVSDVVGMEPLGAIKDPASK
jgi:nitrogen regulatory protein PII